MNGEPRRLWEARTKRGDKNHDIATKILYDAAHVALENQGLHREMTMERRRGDHIKRYEQTQQSYYRAGFEKEIANNLNQYVKEDPDIFIKEPRETVDKILKEFQLDITILKQYPLVIDAMFTKLGVEVPENLIIEKELHEMLSGMKQSEKLADGDQEME